MCANNHQLLIQRITEIGKCLYYKQILFMSVKMMMRVTDYQLKTIMAFSCKAYMYDCGVWTHNFRQFCQYQGELCV